MKRDSPEFASIRQHYLFAGLENDVFDGLAAKVTLVRHGKGSVLFHRGDPADSFYYVATGQIEIGLVAPGGEKKIMEVVGPGATFAEAVAFMRVTRYPATAVALSDATLCRVPNAPYIDILRNDTDACLRLLCDVSRHLHARVGEIERLTIQNARDRLAGFLLDQVLEPQGDEATVHLQLPRHVIAARLSIQPETLSRLLRQMTDENLIAVDDRYIRLLSIDRLRGYDSGP